MLVYNSSLIDVEPGRADINVVAAPANEIANQLGSNRVANMVALGALLKQTEVVSVEAVMQALAKALPKRRQDLLPINREAIERGQALSSAVFHKE